MNTVNCPGCNRAVNPNQARCLYCGENIRGPEKTCPACNRPANPKQKRCMYCGENISGKSARVCTKCGRPGSVGQKRCFYCGGSFPEEENKEEKQCTACGTILEEHQNFCIECGTPYGEQKSATEIPGLPDDFEFPRNRKTIIRSMVCSGDYMEVEKGFPPDTYRINWNDIRKVNCYKIDIYEDEDEIAPGPNMSRETAAKVARFWAKKLDVKTTDDSLFTFYIVENFFRRQ